MVSRSRTGIAFIHNPMRAWLEQGMRPDPDMVEQCMLILQQQQPGPKNKSRRPRRSNKLKRKVVSTEENV